MSIITWAAMAPAITADLPDVPRFTAMQALQREAQQFYRDTRAWRATGVALATTVLGQSVYTVTTANPAGAALAGLPAVWVGGQAVDELAPGVGDDYLSTDTSATPAVGVAGATSIVLAPLPSSAGLAITGTVAYAPTDASTGLDDALWLLHREAIEAGAKERLKVQPGKPWSDPAGAMYWRNEANRLAAFAAAQAGPARQRRAMLRVRAV